MATPSPGAEKQGCRGGQADDGPAMLEYDAGADEPDTGDDLGRDAAEIYAGPDEPGLTDRCQERRSQGHERLGPRSGRMASALPLASDQRTDHGCQTQLQQPFPHLVHDVPIPARREPGSMARYSSATASASSSLDICERPSMPFSLATR